MRINRVTIPKDHEFFPKVMESVQDGKEHSIAEIKEYCVTNLNYVDKNTKNHSIPTSPFLSI